VVDAFVQGSIRRVRRRAGRTDLARRKDFSGLREWQENGTRTKNDCGRGSWAILERGLGDWPFAPRGKLAENQHEPEKPRLTAVVHSLYVTAGGASNGQRHS